MFVGESCIKHGHRRDFTRTRAVGAALALASGTVCAQTVPATTPAANRPAHALPAVVVTTSQQSDAEQGYRATRATVATRTDTPLADTPQTVNVVTSQSIEDRRPDSLAEALETVPGVRMGNTLGGTLDAIIKRGFGDNRDNSILRDGMQSVQPRNFTPTTERVEVLKGPASMLYGIQDPGGLVNVVTKKPEQTTRRSISGFTSSHGGGGAQVDLTGPLGTSGFAYRLIADHQRVDYWRNFGYTRQDTIAPSLAWYGRDTNVLLQYEHMSYAVPLDRGTIIDKRTGNPVAIPKTERLDEPYNVSAGRSDALNLRVDHKLNANWTLRAGYGWGRMDYGDEQARVMGANFATGMLTRRVDSTQNGVQSVHNLTLNLEGKVEWLGLKHDLLAGVDYMRNYRVLDDLFRGKKSTTFNMYAPVYGQQPATYQRSPRDSHQTDKLIERGAFVQDAVHIGDRWIVLGGVRYENYQELTGKGEPFVVGASTGGSRLVPHAGVVYKLTPAWSTYASYSESFRPNTSIAAPIGALPPEQGKAWEIGTRWESDRLSASAALFDIRKQNIRTTETRNGINYARNAGRARSRGLELEAVGQLTDRWSVIASYALTEARYQNDPKLAGNPLPNTPKHAAAFYLTRDFGNVGFSAAATGRLRAGGGLRVFSALPVGDGTGKVYRMPYGRVVDLFVAWNSRIYGTDIDWQFNVRNLFDSTYYTGSCCTGTPFVSIGDGRQAVLSAKLNF